MTMPKATIYKDCCSEFRKDDIRLTWQMLVIHTVPESMLP